MKPLSMHPPIKWKEIGELGEFLLEVNEGRAFTIDELDGFFCALICGRDLVQPSEFLPVIFGMKSVADPIFATEEEANHYLSLIFRLWNSIASTFMSGKMYKLVIFDEDLDGVPSSARWANGFRTGMNMRLESWEPLFDAEEAAVLFHPLMLLGQQWSETGQVNPLPEANLEMLVANVMAALPVIYALNRSAQPGKRKPAPRKSATRKRAPKSNKRYVN
jgi:uncharacterized protein